jgi:uncharacterized protein
MMIKTDSKYISKRTFSWVNQKVEIKDTRKYGIGAFAKEKILKDEKIVMFGGHVMTREEENLTPEEIYDNAIQIDEDLVIGAKTKDEIEDGSMFNHSCNANSGIRGQILLVAMRDILNGEQITFDFGTVLYHKDGIKPYKLKCLCGEDECRGTITDDDWKKTSVQEKYKGYFPLHIQDKIDNINK